MGARSLVLASGLALAGCQTVGSIDDPIAESAEPVSLTATGYKVETLPGPKRRITVGIYEIKDQTGQHKPNDNFAEYSRAVTQGSESILIDVLKSAGKGTWFRVMERSSLKNLLQERNIFEVGNEVDLRRDLLADLGTGYKSIAEQRRNPASVLEAQAAVAEKQAALSRAQAAAVRAQANFQGLQQQAGGLAQAQQPVPPPLQQQLAGAAGEFERAQRAQLAAQSELEVARANTELARAQGDHAVNRAQQEVALNKAHVEIARDRAAKMPALVGANLLIEGAIVGYDANETTSGAGARYLGIGADKQYRRDMVTVSLRLVDVRSGEVALAVTATKTVYSYLLRGGIYRFASLGKLLETEIGKSKNEPPTLAVRHAFELAVFMLIAEGAKKGVWSLQDAAAQAKLIEHYEGRYVREPGRIGQFRIAHDPRL
jgi:curli production assembly/transport component CsgG